MRFSIFQDSALGGRASNQDRMGYCFTRESLLMVVADGMGGHLRGEVAAQITMQTAGAVFQQMAKPVLGDPIGFLDHALRQGSRVHWDGMAIMLPPVISARGLREFTPMT